MLGSGGICEHGVACRGHRLATDGVMRGESGRRESVHRILLKGVWHGLHAL